MSTLIDYVRESVLTAPDDLELHALLPWARGEAPLPLSEHLALNALVREWWREQTNASVLLRELVAVDRRLGVIGACACAQWAVDHYWFWDLDERPGNAIATALRWTRGEATEKECDLASDDAFAAAEDAGRSYAGSTSCSNAGHAAALVAALGSSIEETENIADVVESAAYACLFTEKIDSLVEIRGDLCDVVRAAVECPPVEVWFAIELKRDSQ